MSNSLCAALMAISRRAAAGTSICPCTCGKQEFTPSRVYSHFSGSLFFPFFQGRFREIHHHRASGGYTQVPLVLRTQQWQTRVVSFLRVHEALPSKYRLRDPRQMLTQAFLGAAVKLPTRIPVIEGALGIYHAARAPMSILLVLLVVALTWSSCMKISMLTMGEG
jgi:hypothetical protein